MSTEPSGGGPTNRQLGLLAVTALVVVVIAVVIIAVSTGGSTHHPSQPAGTGTTSTAATTTPSFTGTVVRPTITAPVTTAPSSGGALTPTGGPVPSGFSPLSFTAVSDTVWWVLGSATCSSPPCTSIVRTVDGGTSFVGIPAPRSSAVNELRFADLHDGYAYGADQLWSTHDGGQTWNRVAVSGSVQSVAISGGDVFVATSRGLLRSPVSSDSFTTLERGDFPSVWAEGFDVFADSQSSGGVPSLLSSADRGSSFQQYAAPGTVLECRFSSTGDGVIWAPCATGLSGSVWRSTDGGSQWAATNPTGGQPRTEPNSAPFAAASADTAVYGAEQLYRTTDGGQSWAAVTGFPEAHETIAYLGFTDASHGVAIVDGDATASASSRATATLYYTTDGGVSYEPVTIKAG